MIPRWMNVVRAVSSEGFRRLKYCTDVRRRLNADGHVRRYFEHETTERPAFSLDQVRHDLGALWQCLSADACPTTPTPISKSAEGQSLG